MIWSHESCWHLIITHNKIIAKRAWSVPRYANISPTQHSHTFHVLHQMCRAKSFYVSWTCELCRLKIMSIVRASSIVIIYYYKVSNLIYDFSCFNGKCEQIKKLPFSLDCVYGFSVLWYTPSSIFVSNTSWHNRRTLYKQVSARGLSELLVRPISPSNLQNHSNVLQYLRLLDARALE